MQFIKGDEVIWITKIPRRKKPILAIGDLHTLKKLASFDSEESADEFIDVLSSWLHVDADKDEED